jgi:hypothetical protein
LVAPPHTPPPFPPHFIFFSRQRADGLFFSTIALTEKKERENSDSLRPTKTRRAERTPQKK